MQNVPSRPTPCQWDMKGPSNQHLSFPLRRGNEGRLGRKQRRQEGPPGSPSCHIHPLPKFQYKLKFHQQSPFQHRTQIQFAKKRQSVINLEPEIESLTFAYAHARTTGEAVHNKSLLQYVLDRLLSYAFLPLLPGTLAINAGSPWIRLLNTSTLVAKKGASAKLTERSIRVDTNVDLNPMSIRVRVLEPPQHGAILVCKKMKRQSSKPTPATFSSSLLQVNGSKGLEFSLGEMTLGLVSYENLAVTEVGRDGFGFEALVNGETSTGPQHFDILIYPEAYWTPLTVSLS